MTEMLRGLFSGPKKTKLDNRHDFSTWSELLKGDLTDQDIQNLMNLSNQVYAKSQNKDYLQVVVDQITDNYEENETDIRKKLACMLGSRDTGNLVVDPGFSTSNKDLIMTLYSRLNLLFDHRQTATPGSVMAVLRQQEDMYVFIHVPFQQMVGGTQVSTDDVYLLVRDGTHTLGGITITLLNQANSPACTYFQTICMEEITKQDEEALTMVIPPPPPDSLPLAPELEAHRQVHDSSVPHLVGLGTLAPRHTNHGQLRQPGYFVHNPEGGGLQEGLPVGQLYVKSFTDDNTRKLWFLIVLGLLKLNPEDKNRLMEPLLAMVARELFGIECETVHDVHTTVHSTSEADGHDHHHITGVSAQGKIFIAYKNGNNIEFLYQGLEPPTKEICHPIGNDLSGWLHKFFTSRTRVSGEKAEQTNPTSAYENDLMVLQPVHSAPHAESLLLPTKVPGVPIIIIQHRAHATDEPVDPRTRARREWDQRQWDRPDPNEHERRYMRQVFRNP
jgi:hypothetical protein